MSDMRINTTKNVPFSSIEQATDTKEEVSLPHNQQIAARVPLPQGSKVSSNDKDYSVQCEGQQLSYLVRRVDTMNRSDKVNGIATYILPLTPKAASPSNHIFSKNSASNPAIYQLAQDTIAV